MCVLVFGCGLNRVGLHWFCVPSSLSRSQNNFQKIINIYHPHFLLRIIPMNGITFGPWPEHEGMFIYEIPRGPIWEESCQGQGQRSSFI